MGKLSEHIALSAWIETYNSALKEMCPKGAVGLLKRRIELVHPSVIREAKSSNYLESALLKAPFGSKRVYGLYSSFRKITCIASAISDWYTYHLLPLGLTPGTPPGNCFSWQTKTIQSYCCFSLCLITNANVIFASSNCASVELLLHFESC